MHRRVGPGRLRTQPGRVAACRNRPSTAWKARARGSGRRTPFPPTTHVAGQSGLRQTLEAPAQLGQVIPVRSQLGPARMGRGSGPRRPDGPTGGAIPAADPLTEPVGGPATECAAALAPPGCRRSRTRGTRRRRGGRWCPRRWRCGWIRGPLRPESPRRRHRRCAGFRPHGGSRPRRRRHSTRRGDGCGPGSATSRSDAQWRLGHDDA